MTTLIFHSKKIGYPMKLTKQLLTFVLSLATSGLWAQNSVDLGKLPEAKWTDVKVTEIRYAVFSTVDTIIVNPQTGRMDTVSIDKGMKVYTEDEYKALEEDYQATAEKFLKRVQDHAARRGAPAVDWYKEWQQEGKHERSASRLYYFKYPSVDADGNQVILSAMMGVPYSSKASDVTGSIGAYIGFIGGPLGSIAGKRLFSKLTPDSKVKPKNVVIGCHVTITSNWEAPTSYNRGKFKLNKPMTYFGLKNFMTDTSMMLYYTRNDVLRQSTCLVILPDYEGYGDTSNRPHPYLYQELTARQCVDATRYGLALYNHYVDKKEAEPMADNWKTVSVGFSQGGSVSLATHKFIETNNLVDDLHFAGSVCGDGPYDPVRHLLYYMTDDGETYDGKNRTKHKKETVSMPIVMPLILKGMCDSNPYMRQHKISDYLTQNFLNTGVIGFIESKSKAENDQFSTNDVNAAFRQIKKKGTYNGKTITDYDKLFPLDDGSNVHGALPYMLTDGAISDFRRLTKNESMQNDYMKDLVAALESNNLTVGWVPQKRVALYHTSYDTVVPYVNMLSFIRNQNGLSYFFHDKNRKRSQAAGVNPTNIVTDEKKADVYIYDDNCNKDHVPAGQQFFLLGRFDNAPDKYLMNWVLDGKK